MKPQKNSILRFETIGSTNRYLRENIDVLETGTVVVAEKQTEGRGRLGKNWNSDNSMLMFSMLIKKAEYPKSVGLAAAVSVIKALEKLYKINALIKWPNDIIAENRKVCGILCESRIRRDSENTDKKYETDVICGIGINTTTKNEFFAKNMLPHAGSLKSIYGIDADREILLNGILTEFFPLLDESFTAIKSYYAENCLTLGKKILIVTEKNKTPAKALDITEEGFLVCESLSGETFTVNSGEVSIRGFNGYF